MAHSEKVSIRKAKRADLSGLIPLMEAHALYEHATFNPSQQEVRLATKIFEDAEPLHCLVAEAGGSLIGYATYLRQYATWEAGYYLYLDCLYFREEYRGMGLGRKIMELIKEEGRQMGISQIQWQTPSFNEGAIAFYEKIGAQSKAKARFFLSTEEDV